MSKSVLFRVEVTFADNVEQDEDIMQIAQNIARAIVNEANGEGIAPQNDDNYTKEVRVTPWYINKTVIENIC
jgi:hypothetical protein